MVQNMVSDILVLQLSSSGILKPPLAPVHRNQRKKKALADTKTQFNKLTGENKQLLKHLEDSQRENYEVTEYLRQELLTKNELVQKLEADNEQVGITRAAHAGLSRRSHAQRTHGPAWYLRMQPCPWQPCPCQIVEHAQVDSAMA